MAGIGWRNMLPASRIGPSHQQPRIETPPTFGDTIWPQSLENTQLHLLTIGKAAKARKGHDQRFQTRLYMPRGAL
jgi:hypothetical protein